MSGLAMGTFFGKVEDRYKCPGFLLSELRHTCGRALPEHSHEAAYFSLLLEGAYRENAQGRRLEYTRFATAYHPPGMSHQDEIGGGGGLLFTIELETGTPADLPRHPLLLNGPPIALRLFRDHRAGVLSAIEVESIACELLGQARHSADSEESGTPRWLRRVLENMRDDPSFPHTVKSLSGQAGIHPVHLARVFRRRFGYPLSDFLHSLRLQLVMRDLQNPERSLADIACSRGFSDQSHLTRVFKHWVGVPPARFRRECVL